MRIICRVLLLWFITAGFTPLPSTGHPLHAFSFSQFFSCCSLQPKRTHESPLSIDGKLIVALVVITVFSSYLVVCKRLGSQGVIPKV